MATASKGSVAGNNLIAEELRTSISRFFAQVPQAATQPNTSAASEGQYYLRLRVRYILVSPGCPPKGDECFLLRTSAMRERGTATRCVPSCWP